MGRSAILAVIALSGCFATAGLAAGARADEDGDFQKRVFGRPVAKDEIHACFKRLYEPAHLAAHPQQNVRTMTLLVTGYPAGDNGPTHYGVSIGVTFRKSGQHFETYGDCASLHDAAGSGPAGTVHCSVECDGGSMDVRMKDAGAALVSIPEGARLWRPGGDETEGSVKQRFGPDDKLFRVDKTKLIDCLSLASDDKKPALRRGQ
jgi:hypothetical protein